VPAVAGRASGGGGTTGRHEGNGAGLGSLAGVPELPEVESVRRQLVPRLTGRRIVAVWWDPHPHARFHAVERLVGRRIDAVGRRGKFLVCPLGGGTEDADLELVLHLGMTGSLRVGATCPDGTDPDAGLSHVRARLDLDDAHTLRFRDPRRFGRLSVVADRAYEQVVPTLAILGPEPLSAAFTVDGFAAGLAATRAPVKARLLDQRLVAGVGNIYADEILHRARLRPDRSADTLDRRRIVGLHDAVVGVLDEAIAAGGSTLGDAQYVDLMGKGGSYQEEHRVYGRAGERCSTCGVGWIRRSVTGGRGTHWCGVCQR